MSAATLEQVMETYVMPVRDANLLRSLLGLAEDAPIPPEVAEKYVEFARFANRLSATVYTTETLAIICMLAGKKAPVDPLQWFTSRWKTKEYRRGTKLGINWRDKPTTCLLQTYSAPGNRVNVIIDGDPQERLVMISQLTPLPL